MNKVFLSYGPLISSLGNGIPEHIQAFKNGESGLKKCLQSGFKKEDWCLGRIEHLHQNRYEHLLENVLKQMQLQLDSELLANKKTLFLVSSTKGNLDALPKDTFASTREAIQSKFKNPNTPIVVSNACISGVIAVNLAAEYIRSEMYNNVVILGIDVLCDFVVYGFQSLFALSNAPCRPFDKNREGINIGEACGVILASKKQASGFCVEHLAGASSNDANHISGPSRTGEGLYRAISNTLKRGNQTKDGIDFISGHGTATLYNDDMESIALHRLGLSNTPINSMKGYFGHTLGAAGVIEIMMSMASMQEKQLFKTLGFIESGTKHSLAVIEENKTAKINTVLKSASGFGGGNAATLLKCVE